jgi:anti-sigma factor RsiW
VNDDRGHRELRELLGAYVLGQLDPIETGRVRAHLDGCAACRAEHAGIAPLAAALRDVDPDVFDVAQPEPGALVAARIERQVRLERAARRRRTLLRRTLAGAAAVLVLTGTGLGGYALGRPDPAAVVPLEAVQVTTTAPGVRATAALVAHTWGVEIKLTATGLPEGRGYTMSVVGEDGVRHPAGGLVGTGERTMRCNLNADVLRPDAASFTLTDADGQVVLSAEV